MLRACRRACSEIWRDQVEKLIEVTAEAQGNYPNFKQNLAEKIFCHLKSQRKPAAVWQMTAQRSKVQKLTTRALSKGIRLWKQKIIPKSRAFSKN